MNDNLKWQEQQVLLVKIENRFIPQIAVRVQQLYREGLTAYREDKLNDLQNNFFDDKLYRLLLKIYEVSGLSMARFIYKNMPTVRQLEKKATGQMGISATWLQMIRAYLARHGLTFVTDIMRSIKDEMIALFNQSVAEGWSYEFLANKLLKTGLAIKRARTIARTEVHRGSMVGSFQGAMSLPYEVQKQWLSGKDSRVRRRPKDRFDHAELSGQIRELFEPFQNQEQIQFPTDPNASAANTINCRCVLNYLPKRDEKGRLILKNP